jgi:hypothetical protein
MSKLPESLMEFMNDGGKWQLARPAEGTWTSLWQKSVKIAGHETIIIEGGFTSTTDDSHTLVINVTIRPMKLQNGAEDQANETITVYYRDFKSEGEARAEMKSMMTKGVKEDAASLGVQLYQQRPPGTIAI